MSAKKAQMLVRQYKNLLIPFEFDEICKYEEVYFVGTLEAKEQRKISSIISQGDSNNGFDLTKGYYRIVIGDHLAYRYEIISEIDRGAFG
jgi:hypothetical protein